MVIRYRTLLLVCALFAVVSAIVLGAMVAWGRLYRERMTNQGSGDVEVVGYVRRIDADGTAWVARTIFDLTPHRVRIGPETMIRVGAKEGGRRDVREGVQIVVAYQAGHEDAVARWIGINAPLTDLREARGRVPTPSARAPSIDQRSAAPVSPLSGSAVPAPNSAGVQERRRPAAPSSSESSMENELALSARSAAGAPAPPPPSAGSSARPTVAAPGRLVRGGGAVTRGTTPIAPRAAPVAPDDAFGLQEPTSVEQSGSDDPGAVIDWLLRQSRRN